MKKPLFLSYISGVQDHLEQGQSYPKILKYFVPELVTATVFLFCTSIFDSYFIAHLKSTSLTATQGVTTSLLHAIIKLSEGLLVGAVVICGQYNGIQDYKKVGKALSNVFWLTVIFGATIGSFLYFCAYYIYYFYGVTPKMITLGMPLLKLRAISIFLMCIFFGFVGFLRGIKNTYVPMVISIVGGIFFVFIDYALIFGCYGLPECGILGSAMASIIQYVVMLIAVFLYIIFDKENRKFGIEFFSRPSLSMMKSLLLVSWPVMIDKVTLSLAHVWLGFRLAPMGKYALASFSAIKDIERVAILPALACAQVITFLVSNDYKIQNWESIKVNIKKVIFIATILVCAILLAISYNPTYFVRFFDHKGSFTELSVKVLPIISVLVFFDLLQLILSGSLRGAADVKYVMNVRLGVCILFFMPLSYFLSGINWSSPITNFLAVYGTLYISNAIMSLFYIQRFRGGGWKKQTV